MKLSQNFRGKYVYYFYTQRNNVHGELISCCLILIICIYICRWAEGSLLLADEILEDYFSVSRPWEFDAPDFVQQVAQTSSLECTLETGNSGGGSSAGSTGG